MDIINLDFFDAIIIFVIIMWIILLIRVLNINQTKPTPQPIPEDLYTLDILNELINKIPKLKQVTLDKSYRKGYNDCIADFKIVAQVMIKTKNK